MTKEQAREWAKRNRIPKIYILHNRVHYECIQTVLLKIYLGLPIYKQDDLLDYTPLENISNKLDELKNNPKQIIN